MVILRKNSPFIFLFVILFLILQLSSCDQSTPTSGKVPEAPEAGDASGPSSDESEAVELSEMMFAESSYRHLPFSCSPPEKSYLHKKVPTDTYYVEGWEYTIQFNFDENSFTIAHNAGTERHYPEECYSIYHWYGEGDGGVFDGSMFEGVMSLSLELTRGCEEVGESPATEETIKEGYEWWIIGKIFLDNIQTIDEKTGAGKSKWVYKLSTCTCNSKAYDYSKEERDRFYKESICPPCVPGAMICELEIED